MSSRLYHRWGMEHFSSMGGLQPQAHVLLRHRRLGNKVGCKQQCRCYQQNRKPLTLRVTATVHCNQRQQSSLPLYVPTSSCSALPRYHCTAVATYAAKLLRSLGGIYRHTNFHFTTCTILVKYVSYNYRETFLNANLSCLILTTV